MTNQFIGAAGQNVLSTDPLGDPLEISWREFTCRFGSILVTIPAGSTVLVDESQIYLSATILGTIVGDGLAYLPFRIPLGKVVTADGAIAAITTPFFDLTGDEPEDAGHVTYTPDEEDNWPDIPTDVASGADFLAGRVHTLEDAVTDAADVTYTPTTVTDWDSDTDPGNVDDALDQLAERVDDIEPVDAAAGTGSLRTIGTAATAACAGNDARLSDARTPSAHKDSHDPNDGSDPLDTAAAAAIDGVQAAAIGTAHTLARADHAHRIQHAIADNALLTVDQADLADNDFLKATANGVEGRSYAEVKSDLGLEADPALRRLLIHINGGGSEIADGIAVELPDMPASTVEGWTLVGSPSGSLVLDLWSDSYANHPPTVADTMIATGTKPTLSSATKGQDLTVDWADVTIAAGATLTVNVDSCTTCEAATLTLRLRMT